MLINLNRQTTIAFFVLSRTARYADARRLPSKDKEQNYVLTGFEERDQRTVLKFDRKCDTCDPRDRKLMVILLVK